MKKKFLLWVLTITSIMTIGCSNKASKEDDYIDSVIIDENTRKTIDSEAEISVSQVAKIKIDTSELYSGTFINGIVQYYEYSIDRKTDPFSQFPKHYLETLRIGTITNEKDENNLNIINWEDKNIKGQMLVPYIYGNRFLIFKDNKIYNFGEKGDLIELKAYETLIKDNPEYLNRFEPHGNRDINLHYIGEEDNLKLAIVDIEKYEYYELYKNDFEIFKDNSFKILGVEDNKIYIMIGNLEKANFTIGYIEDNKLYDLFPKGGEIEILGLRGLFSDDNKFFISDNKILFSGLVGDLNSDAIWNYDIKNKKLVKIIDLGANKDLSFYINKDKSKIIIRDYEYNTNTYNFRIANINEEFQISNLTNLASIKQEEGIKTEILVEWASNGEEFYLRSYDDENVFYDIYKINN